MAQLPTLQQRFTACGVTLERNGVPKPWGLLVARGLFLQICDHCHGHLTDFLGDSKDVDVLLGWTSPPQTVALAMAAAGMLVQKNQDFYCPYATTMLSYRDMMRWRRTNAEGYKTAKARATPIENNAPAESLTEEPQRDLFGVPVNDKKPAKKIDTGHKLVTRHFMQRWKERYGKDYSFTPRDGQTISALLKRADAAEITAAIDRFIGDDDKFYRGHELGKFQYGFNRFRVGDAGGCDARHGIRYAGGDDDLTLK